jgi:hypothetical protein
MSDPTGRCRDRDKKGLCLVRNEAGAAGASAARELQDKLRQLDVKIKSIKKDERLAIKDNDGNKIGEVSGAQLRTIWSQSRWSIMPADTNHDNKGGGGGAYPGGHVKLNADSFERYVGWAVNRGSTRGSGVATLIFHELGHYTSFGEKLTKQFPVEDYDLGTPEYDYRESRTSSAGRAAATRVGENYVCGIFGNGCF